ncbi:phage tail protein [Yersinia enterocolitica]
MNRTDDPKKQPIPFGVNGPREDIGPTTPTGDNSASYNSGFPPITMLLKASGGLPPKGQDMNQILYELSSLARWTSAGALNVFDSTFSSSISGYPKGAVLSNSTFTGCWLNTVEANAANPENTDGTLTGWVPAFAYGTTALAGLAAANVTLTALQAANERITLAGTLTANINLVLPAWRKSWTIVNNCTGPFSVNCKTPSGTGIAVAAGATARIIGDGTNIISNESPLITGALQKSANLSDLTNAPTARTNLELGTAATKNVGTGVGQIPDMSSFISSFAQNGYFKFPGGLIIQWGEVTGSTTGTVPANFPIPFPNALVSTALAIDLIGPSYATLQNQTLSGISVNTWNSAGNRAALAIRYIAIGW